MELMNQCTCVLQRLAIDKLNHSNLPIRQKSKSQNGCCKKTKHTKFSEKLSP